MQRTQAAHVPFHGSEMRGRHSSCTRGRQAGRRPELMERTQAVHVPFHSSEMSGRPSIFIRHEVASARSRKMSSLREVQPLDSCEPVFFQRKARPSHIVLHERRLWEINFQQSSSSQALFPAPFSIKGFLNAVLVCLGQLFTSLSSPDTFSHGLAGGEALSSNDIMAAHRASALAHASSTLHCGGIARPARRLGVRWRAHVGA